MSRIPPGLLYLTIYNPTLRPSGPVSPDDEDAEEQAHILFYTSKERAVSRDRMLRQVGLAKALVNFSEIFSQEEPCNNIHSQSKRMVMISPEPDYWIHGAIELAKTPRPTEDKSKSKAREKEKAKAKDKGKAKEQPSLYDYHDGSIHDSALRAQIHRGYEQFKLMHGTFASILSVLGQEALELQLERFFTVWAWTWDFENGTELGADLGISLHPLYRSLAPLLDEFTSNLPHNIAPIIISTPHVIPSSRFTDLQYPPSLSRHLLSLRPPSLPSTREPIDQSTKASLMSPEHANISRLPAVAANPESSQPEAKNSGSTFLGMPAVNMNMPDMNLGMNMNMDVRKWSWPGVLTFGKGHGKKASKQEGVETVEATNTMVETNAEEQSETQGVPAINVDTNSLEDAMASDARSIIAASAVSSVISETDPPAISVSEVGAAYDGNLGEENSGHISIETSQVLASEATPTNSRIRAPSLKSKLSSIALTTSSHKEDMSRTSSQKSLPAPALEFSITIIHLPSNDKLLATERRKLFHLRASELIIAFVEHTRGNEHEKDSDELFSAGDFVSVLEDFRNIIDNEFQSTSMALPSATNILQPQDRHMISKNYLVESSPDFAPKAEQFYYGKQLLDKDSDISEVFSRGQHPQHWHVARRGVGINDDGSEVEGKIFLEVSRKEASLTDVDNVLVSIVKRSN